jgi:uncharacterized protein
MTIATPIRISAIPPAGAAAANLATLTRAYAAFAARDIPGVLEAFAPEARWDCHGAPHLPCAGSWHGRAGLIDFFTAVATMAEVLVFAPGPIQALPDGRVISEGLERLRFRRSGIETTTSWLHLVRFRNGRIVEGVEWNEGAVLAAAYRGA